MGRKSIKENKNIYQIKREELGLTREKAAEKMDFISADRLEKIENERINPSPEDVLAISEAYNEPSLCNHYCSQECPIGIKYVPEVTVKSLSQISLEMAVTLNSLSKQKDRLMEITVDGVISEDEQAEFADISDNLDKMAMAIDAMRLWVEQNN